MADISKEIQDFQEAVYGEEVRGSLISLAEKVNTESTAAKEAAVNMAGIAAEAVAGADEAVERADAAVFCLLQSPWMKWSRRSPGSQLLWRM